MLLTLLGIITDIGLGLIAYRLARKLEIIQQNQTLILSKLATRVETLERYVYPSRVGFNLEKEGN